MIPSTTGFLDTDFVVTNQPTKTYAMELDGNRVRGYTDGQEAMKQAIFKILNTERYQYEMYSWNYGVEFRDLYGQPVNWCVPEIERRIQEALTWDDRIDSVDSFEFNISKRGVIAVSFTAHTIFGDLQEETEVNI